MTDKEYRYQTALQYKVKALERQLNAFLSGEKYLKLKESHRKELDEKNKEICHLRKERDEARIQVKKVRNLWFDVFEEMAKNHSKEQTKKDTEIEKLKAIIQKMQIQLDHEHEALREKRLELYAVQTTMEEKEGMIKKLQAQVNKDFENSSVPSSMQGLKRKKIPNSREKTGRRPGGQPGHKGACRKKYPSTQEVIIDPPKEVLEDPNYYKTREVIEKQLICLKIDIDVIDFKAPVYRNRLTGTRIHGTFPKSVVNEVNYDGSIKAFLQLLCTECNVSAEKAQTFLGEVSGGRLKVSRGMISSLCREFSEKSQAERTEIVNKLLSSSVMHTDFTNSNVNGKAAQVLILATPSGNNSLFIARENKGHKGVADTPLEDYTGTVVHDHDKTFYAYGTAHQECMQHNIRYLKGSIENEPEREWNKEMLELIRRMLHYKKHLEGEPDMETVRKLEEEYKNILKKAKDEYEYEPPSDYYRDGFNLYKRLDEYSESQLRFLHYQNVPADNSVDERLARVFKRKQKQAIVFRSFDSLEHLCQTLSILHTKREAGCDVYRDTIEIFNRPGEKNPYLFKKDQSRR